MENIWWTTTLVPGEGWAVYRLRKVANLWPTSELVADRLVALERDQVLEDDATWVLSGALA